MNFTDEDMYLDLLHYIMNNGEERANERTGVGTKSVFGYTLNFDLTKGFPLFTTKKVPFKSVLSELLWFLEGSQNERRLAEIHYGKPKAELIGKTTIWTANADNQGKAMGHYNTNTNKDLGPVYGVQWRNWNGIDQIARLIDGLKNDPQSRRHILSAWNVSDLDRMALPPCHCFAQFYVTNDGGLKTILHQRSADLFLGVPFNIASYSLLTHMIAQVTGLTALELIHNIGDVHIYDNHTNAINTQLARVEDQRPLPTLVINPDIKSIDDFKMEDFEITGYDPHPFIPAPMAV